VGAAAAAAVGGRSEGSTEAKPVNVGIVGAGSIGVAWAIVFARAGHAVRIFEPDGSRRDAALPDVTSRLAALADEGLISCLDVGMITARVSISADLRSALAGVSYVQECAPEQLALKRELFAELDLLAAADAVLASSSSALTASAITAGLPGADRCLIAHPGNPPYLLPVVELVPSPLTRAGVVDAAEALLRSAGMQPVRIRKEIEGFVFNRLQGAVLREAYRLVRDDVVTPEDLDIVMRAGLGRRWSLLGPFETAELNTRGGIEAHASIMGPAYARMAAPGETRQTWDAELVGRVSESVSRRLPRAQWADHVAWRDRALMALERFRRDHPILAGPPASQAAPPESVASR
jgi:3-hydroxyacyl-CoA dehydrogenase